MSKTNNTATNNTMTGTTPRRHIPAGFIQPPLDAEVIWDNDNVPFYYRRNFLQADYFDAEISISPLTGEERINVEMHLDRATAREARLAMGQLCAWFMVVVEARPLVESFELAGGAQ